MYILPRVMGDELSELEQLRRANKALEEQLKFSRQKASLYYVAMSELDAVRNRTASFVERIDACTNTSEDAVTERLNVASQTDQTTSAELEYKAQLELAQTEIGMLRSFIDSMKRTEPVRARLIAGLSTDIGDTSIVTEYMALFEQFMKQNKLSVNHSVEIKRRDEMISSLFEKIRIMEDAFRRKLEDTKRVADTRQQVIDELGDQIKQAVNEPIIRSAGSESDWSEVAALQAEMEDLKAELSMARTNWAATRDELVRLQFRVGVDGNGGSRSSTNAFPAPVIDILETTTRETGLISGIRNIRQNPPSL